MIADLSDPLDVLRTAICECMLRDQKRFRRQLKQIRRQRRDAQVERCTRKLSTLTEAVEASSRLRERRQANLPIVQFDEQLPVGAKWRDVASLIDANQVCIVAGATGSGKSTQIPKICLALGRGVGAMIGHTQPRRIAARAIANRLTAELPAALLPTVGYKVRFNDTVNEHTYIKLMTDGILLGELNADRLLERYDTLIIDEAHERSLNIDFLLGYLKRVLPRRPDLKVIITSATIDTKKFSRHFDDAPILEIEGRGYPVEIEYCPLTSGEPSESDDAELHAAVVDAVRSIAADKSGDVLVFLPSERDIRELSTMLVGADLDLVVLALYGRMDNQEQDRVFSPTLQRKVVLATNVAETALTVPGISYVVDSGLVRMSRYSYRNKVQRLPIERISKASANQRSGRCGRTGPGRCIRLYAQTEYERFAEHTDAELRRTSLAAVILRMKALALGNIEDFSFIDAPDARFVRDGVRLLTDLDALDSSGGLTPLGQKLARLPVDPKIGCMVIAASRFGSLQEVLVIAAALSVQDPFACSSELRGVAAQARRGLQDKHSDLIGYLNFWQRLEKLVKCAGALKLRAFCKQYFVSWRRLVEWREVHAQLVERAAEVKLDFNTRRAPHAAIYQALLCGCLNQIGRKSSHVDYQGARGTHFTLSPGSVLSGKNVTWVMAAELLETRRVYAHRASRLRAEWLENCAPERLLKKTHAEPYFDAAKGVVFANERVHLHGLPIVTRRKRPYDAVDSEQARRVFIASALVGGLIRSGGAFLTHNQSLVARLEQVAEKARRTDILADELRMVSFYDARVPAQIARTSKFEQWRRQIEDSQPRFLFMEEPDVRDMAIQAPAASLFPEQLALNAHRFPVRYRFAPGAADDGATVTLPTVLINQLSAEQFEWGVPGWLSEKVTALLRGLPKNLRRRIVPLADCAALCLRELQVGQGGLLLQLSRIVKCHHHVDVPIKAWRAERLAPHLLMNFELLNSALKPSVSGRDLNKFKQRFATDAALSFESIAGQEFNREGITDWDFELSESIELRHGTMTITGYPALIDTQDSVAIRLVDTVEKANRASFEGIQRLARLHLSKDLKRIRRALPDISKIGLLYASVPVAAGQSVYDVRTGTKGMVDDILDSVIQVCLVSDLNRVFRTRVEFDTWLLTGRAVLVSTAEALCALLLDCLERYHSIRAHLDRLAGQAPAESIQDLHEQLSALIYQGFVVQTDFCRLREYRRYLSGIQARVGKLATAANKDLKRLKRLSPLRNRVSQALGRDAGAVSPDTIEFRWTLEELRIAMFAQEVGALAGISLEGVEASWEQHCTRLHESDNDELASHIHTGNFSA